MDNTAFKNPNFGDEEDEEVPDSFSCCVCLDLLYKPIVLSCGHICCFWCVYKSMNCLRESQCPTCRHQYYHFPTVCQALHFLLLKIYPVAYNRRINQTLEEEKKSGFYSPQFDPDTCESQAKFGHSCSPSSSSMINPVPNSCNVETFECTKQPEFTAHEAELDPDTCESQAKFGHSCSPSSSSMINPVPNSCNVETFECTKQPEFTAHEAEPETTGTPAEEKTLSHDKLDIKQKISVADVMCTMCKQLLFRPVVLNCGHVYCETCVYKLADEMLRCQVCQSPHPRGFPKVCLEFNHFLEEQFAEEYARRSDAIELKENKVKPETPSCSLDKGNKGENAEWWSDPDLKVHIGVGCDFCGMFPIIGDRYRCTDCKEKMGFDLCKDCYDTRSKLPGRFNQQHTSDHSFKLVQPNYIRNIMLRLVTGQLGDRSIDTESLSNIDFTAEASGLFDDGEDNQNDPEATD